MPKKSLDEEVMQEFKNLPHFQNVNFQLMEYSEIKDRLRELKEFYSETSKDASNPQNMRHLKKLEYIAQSLGGNLKKNNGICYFPLEETIEKINKKYARGRHFAERQKPSLDFIRAGIAAVLGNITIDVKNNDGMITYKCYVASSQNYGFLYFKPNMR